MANIMITKRCNLKCPYCFANEFVNKNNVNMTMEDYIKAIDFIMTEQGAGIGIIGGEPTMHPQFKEMLEILIHDTRVNQVTIFTNGINIDKFVEQLVHPKFALLINCNSPIDTGEAAYNKLVKNLDLFVNQYYMGDRITLGINMYKPDFDYDYILDLLKVYGFKYLRTAISVPNTEDLKNTDAITYFKEMKPSVLSFYYKVLENNIVPFYDCNMMPSCILTNKEKDKLYYLIENTEIEDRNLLCNMTTCEPVIDILPDLKAIRCFALSDNAKVRIEEFENIFELKAYFNNMFDCFGYNVLSSSECKDCNKRKLMQCSGGCYAFKINKIIEAQNLVSQIS
ncbi:MAG: hypothetical protein CVU84_13900 [Firmicutes bacterium HGW-Firmicutes-1]|nr:MAG: hypothetical protein CVU84_13900 [Firmicutes bacterium HGW-Firmicutes-1]